MTSKQNYRDGPAGDPSPEPLADEGEEASGGAPSFDEAAIETREVVVGSADHAARLDKWLAQQAPEFSRSHLQGLIEQGHVRLSGQTCTQCSRRLRAGQTVAVDLIPTAEALAFRPEPMPLAVIFEDEHLMVIDKAAGLVVHPGAGNWSGTLLNGLLAHHAGAARLPRAGIVHRLDKGTSGLMVVGKTLVAVTELVRQIAARDVRREYVALAHGRFEPAEQVFDGAIGRDPGSRLRMAVTAGGKPARTDVRRLAQTSQHCALACRLHTGRTHQIRVHLSQAGHPLVGDTLYGGATALGLQRPALHARRLGLVHPVLGTELSFEATLPADLAEAWRQVDPAGRMD